MKKKYTEADLSAYLRQYNNEIDFSPAVLKKYKYNQITKFFLAPALSFLLVLGVFISYQQYTRYQQHKLIAAYAKELTRNNFGRYIEINEIYESAETPFASYNFLQEDSEADFQFE